MTRAFFQGLYFVRAAGRGLASSPVTTGVAVATIAIALVLVGGFFVITSNMRVLLERAGEGLGVTVYLEPGVSLDAARDLATRVAATGGVEGVTLVSPDEALERLRRRLGEEDLLEGLEDNPLPASLELTLAASHRTPEGIAALSAELAALPGVEEVGSGGDWAEGYARALSLLRTLGLGLGGVLAFATLVIVANTIRLAVYARRDELEILALVGASRTFRRVPFVLEGIAQGLAGGVLALGLVYLGFQVALPGLASGLELFLGWSDPVFLSPEGMLLLLADGALLGALGAASALFWERLP